MLEGELLGRRYRLGGPLGAGGAGRVFAATDEVTGRAVAVKVVDPASAGSERAARSELIHLRGLVHPRLVRLLDHGAYRSADDGLLRYLVTDVVRGAELDVWCRGRAVGAALGVVAQVLEALAALHASGVRHGDVKPANVLVAEDGAATLLDLSCAQRLHEPAWPSGTPGFVAPEVLRGEPADERADLYGLGATLRAISEACVGERPRALDRLVARLSAEDRRDRPTSVGEVVEALGLSWTPPDAQAVPTRLIGRAEARRRFADALAALGERRTGPRVVLLVGGEGAGKTRLYDELRMEAQERVRVVSGSAADPDAARSMLLRALDAPDRAASALELHGELCAGGEPVVLALDDADLLGAVQRAEWDTIVRGLDPGGTVLVLSTLRPSAAAPDHALVLAVDPLSREEIELWLGDRGLRVSADEVLALTGGIPSEIRLLLTQATGAEEAAGSLARRFEGISAAALLDGLSEPERATLALVAASRDLVDDAAAGALGADPRALRELARRGLLAVEASGYRLRRRSARASTLEVLGEQARAAHRALAARARALAVGLDPESARAADLGATALRHLVEAGDLAAAVAALEAARASSSRHPDAWAHAAEALSASGAPGERWRLDAATILEAAGEWRAALGVLARSLARRPAGPVRARLRLRAAAAYLKGGALGASWRLLTRAIPALEGDERARAFDLESRLHARRGSYAEALASAREGARIARDASVVADLLDSAGVALAYAGDTREARSALRRAAAMHASQGRRRAEARSVAYAALCDYRAGDAPAALAGFDRSRRLAERVGASDLATYGAQNEGSAAHQLGELGRALSAYGAALRLARALGDRAAELGASANLAKLYADLGLFERAAAEAERVEARADAAGLGLLAGVAASVLGEVALARGAYEGALGHFHRAELHVRDAPRERVEIALHVAEALAATGAHARASEVLDEAAIAARRVAVPDLDARFDLSRGRVQVAAGAPGEALGTLERALAAAERTGQRQLTADIRVALVAASRAAGRPEDRSRHARAARALLQRTSAQLEPSVAESYLEDPRRRLDPPAEAESPRPTRERRLETLLAINKKLNSSLDVTRVLEWTIDSALDLTGAERGLVLALEGDALRIVAARNIDPASPEAVDYSTTIARRVLETVAPLVTVDAREDERLSGASIHAMRLTSVAAVPIVAPAAVLGVLYVDHRRRRGLFEREDVDLLGAFADQVALALTNARLHEELGRRTRELDALARGQSHEIEELTRHVHAQQEALEVRFDYGRIVGRRSAGMRALFRILDRVIETDVTVLVQGESGTGKELLAKAIHYNSGRRKGPLLSVNCGAVPEPLLESELFGHVRGAFTGASQDKPGLFQAAQGGTIFLDEIGEMPPAMQVKLLRVLQEQEVTPLGSNKRVALDVRVVAATNRRLDEEVREGRFREDLYYRIGVVEVVVPPLRERVDDLPELVDHLVGEAARRAGIEKPRVPAATVRALAKHRWPGNVRQLENVLLKAVLLHGGEVLTPQALEVAPAPSPRTRGEAKRGDADELLTALRSSRWNVSEVARRLGLSRPTVYRRMREIGAVEPER